MLLRCRIASVCALVLFAATGLRAQVQTLIEPVGIASTVQTATVTITTGGTLAQINVLTLGAPNLDFNLAAGGTCTLGTTYTAGKTCTVEFTFTPTHPGLRFGGISLSTNAQVLLGNAYVSGLGTGPQVIYSPAPQSLLGGPYVALSGAAVDGAGDIFVSDQGGNAVYEITNGVQRQIGTFALPDDVAVDGSGNVFVIYNRNALAEIPAVNGVIPNSPTSNVLYTNFNGLNGMKVDGSGNVYVAEGTAGGGPDSLIQEVLAVNGSIPPNPTPVTLVSGVGSPTGVAIDALGNLFFSDEDGNSAWEVKAMNGVIPTNPTPVALSTNLAQPSNIALDAAGDVFVTEAGDVAELVALNGVVPTNPTIVKLGSNLVFPQGMAVDGSGNIFIADNGTPQAVELDFADAPSLTFQPTAVGYPSRDRDKPLDITNDGNMPLVFLPSTTEPDPNISTGFTFDSNDCPTLKAGTTVPFSLPAGGTCHEALTFFPVTVGPTTGVMTFTDNNLNVTNAQQNVPLFGIGTEIIGVINISSSANPTFPYIPLTVTAKLTMGAGGGVGNPAPPDPGQTVTVTYNPGTGNIVETLVTDANGMASFTIPGGLPVGTFVFVGNFAATSTQEGSYQGFQELVSPFSTTSVLTVFPVAPTSADNVVLTATVSAPLSPVPPTGTVTFFNGAATLGTVPLSGGGVAQLGLTPLAPGAYTFGCTYNGATNFASSQCIPIPLMVQPPPDFSLTATPPSITIETQHHGTMPLTLTSIGPFAGPVRLSCQGTLPPYVTCELPASETLTVGQTLSFNFTIDTDQVLNFLAKEAPARTSKAAVVKQILFALLLPLALTGFVRRRKALRLLMLLVVLTVGMTGLTACSSKWPQHTPPGIYTIPVVGTGTTASGTVLTHTLNITLTVTP